MGLLGAGYRQFHRNMLSSCGMQSLSLSFLFFFLPFLFYSYILIFPVFTFFSCNIGQGQEAHVKKSFFSGTRMTGMYLSIYHVTCL